MKFFSYICIINFIIFSTLTADNFTIPYENNSKIIVKNTILAKVSDKAITTYDVMKKLDIAFNRSFPDLIDSNVARFQFYVSGWKQILEEIINNQLILIDANKKELKITDGEIREEVEIRYGPNVMVNLEKLNLSYEEALKLVKEELIIQKMMYYFIKAKADQKITPSAIRNAYRLHCMENPPQEIWSYYTISIKSNDNKISEEASKQAFDLFNKKAQDPKELENDIKDIEKNYKNCQISISNLYKVTNKEIAFSQQKILSNLEKNSYSDIIYQNSRSTNKKIHRIFYLKDYEKKEIEPFEKISKKLKENLLTNALMEESEKYFTKLKEQYHIDRNPSIIKDFVPFSIE